MNEYTAEEDACKEALLKEIDAMREEVVKEPPSLEKPKEIIKRLQKVADTYAPKKDDGFPIKPICEISIDYFSKEPAEKPVLLSYIEKGDTKAKKIPFLHKEITAMIVAEGGRGKTHLCAHLACCITSGVPFLGNFEIRSPGAACFIVGENNDQDIQRLLFKTRKHIAEMLELNETKGHEKFPTDGKELDRIEKLLYPVSIHGKQAALVDENGKKTDFFYHLLKGLKREEPEEGFQLIIVDPASRFSGASAEKDNAIATAFIASLEEISDNLKGKPTILLSHHKSKAATKESSGQGDARGSTALVDGCRWMATMQKGKEKDTLLFDVAKTNFTPPIQTITIKKSWNGLLSFGGFVEKKIQ